MRKLDESDMLQGFISPIKTSQQEKKSGCFFSSAFRVWNKKYFFILIYLNFCKWVGTAKYFAVLIFYQDVKMEPSPGDPVGYLLMGRGH